MATALAMVLFAVSCEKVGLEPGLGTDEKKVSASQIEDGKPAKEVVEQFMADLLSGVLCMHSYKDIIMYEDGVCIKELGEMSPIYFNHGPEMRYVFNDMVFYEDGTCKMIYHRPCDCEEKDQYLYTKILWNYDSGSDLFTLTSERLAKDEKNTNATTTIRLLSYDKKTRRCTLRGLMPTNITNNWEWIYIDLLIMDEKVRAQIEASYIWEEDSHCGPQGGDVWYYEWSNQNGVPGF